MSHNCEKHTMAPTNNSLTRTLESSNPVLYKEDSLPKPRRFQLNEVIIQSLIRHHLSDFRNLAALLRAYNIPLDAAELEALGERHFREVI